MSVVLDDVISISDVLYPLNDQGLQNIFQYLSEDYNIEDCSKLETYSYEGYYASLKESVYCHACKCDYCNYYNNSAGSRVHGYSCSNCGKVIYRKYLPNSPVRLWIVEDDRMLYLGFIIHSYENDTLYVYETPQELSNWGSVPIKKVPEYLAKYENAFQRVEIGGEKLLAFYYPATNKRYKEDADKVKISVIEVGHPPYKEIPNPEKILGYDYVLAEEDKNFHYQEVQLYKGKEFRQFEQLPVRTYFSIRLDYKHSPIKRDPYLSRNIMSGATLISDCGYYYQDGRSVFTRSNLEEVALYVKYFTDLDLQSFCKFLQKARTDGPGFICNLASHVEAETGIKQYVENSPNIFNAVIGYSKIMNNENLTENEVKSMSLALSDDTIKVRFKDLISKDL